MATATQAIPVNENVNSYVAKARPLLINGKWVAAVSGATVAPASVKARSGKAASWPAPAWTTTSQPAAANRLATSGTRATRRSPGRVSVGTANFTVVVSSS